MLENLKQVMKLDTITSYVVNYNCHCFVQST